MILSQPQARQVLAGQKTQVRVPVRESREQRRRNGTTYPSRPWQPRPGQRLAIHRPAHADDEVCGVIVTSAEHQLLADVDFAAARAEGHRTTTEFRAWWVRTHDAHWVLRQLEHHDDPSADLTDEELVARFEQRHANRAVWAITFTLDREQRPRLLAPTNRSDEHGYTHNPAVALPDEPEAVDHVWLAQFAKEAAGEQSRRRGEVEDALLSERANLGRRLLNAKALARDRGVDVSSDLRVIEQRIAAIENKIRTQRQPPRAA